MKITAIIQARMTSTRLPGKVLKEVNGKPLIEYMIRRISPSEKIDEIVVATSQNSCDNPIVEWCNKNNINCFRGSLDDVLDRFYQCTINRNSIPGVIVRLTADCPLHHYKIVDFAVTEFLNQDLDYFSNSFEPYYEDGFDVEVFSFESLQEAWKNAKRPSEREHVTLWIRNNPKFKRCFKKYRDNYKLKLSVDSNNDFILIEKILDDLYNINPLFTIDEVISLLNEHNEYLEINECSKINEGLEISLRHEKKKTDNREK